MPEEQQTEPGSDCLAEEPVGPDPSYSRASRVAPVSGVGAGEALGD